MLLHNAAGFDRRVVQPLRQWPHRLLWLVASPPDVSCARRVEIATELLQTDDRELEVNALKFRKRFLPALQFMKQTGECTMRVYWLLRSVSMTWKPDVRENERLNKMVGLLQDRCPSAGLDLRSARVALKYLMGEAGEGTNKSKAKWSVFRPVAEKVRQQCLQVWDDVCNIQSDPDRWMPNKKADVLPSDEIQKKYQKLKPHLRTTSLSHIWAASYAVIAHRNLQDQGCLPLIVCIAVRKPGQKRSMFEFWVTADKVRNRYILCPATWAADTNTVSWGTLNGFTHFVKVIQQQYDQVREGGLVRVMQCNVTRLGLGASTAEKFGKQLDKASGDKLCCVTSAVVTAPRPVVTLETPTKQFLHSVHEASADVHHGHETVAPEPGSAAEKSCSDLDQSDGHDTQQMGLRMLAEATEIQCRGSNTVDDGDPDVNVGDDDSDNELGFADLIRMGSAVSFDPDKLGGDSFLQSTVEEKLRTDADENVAAAHETAVAVKMISTREVNIDNPEEQLEISRLCQTTSLDDVEAAVEIAVARSAGVSASGSPRASSSATGRASPAYIQDVQCVNVLTG